MPKYGVTLGEREVVVEGPDTWTDQEIMRAAAVKLSETMGPGGGPIPLTPEGQVPSAPFVSQAMRDVGVRETTGGRVAQAFDVDTPGGVARNAAMLAAGPVIGLGGRLAGAGAKAIPLLGRWGPVTRLAAPYAGEIATGAGYGAGVQAATGGDSDRGLMAGALMGAAQRPLGGLVGGVQDVARAYKDPAQGISLLRRAMQQREMRLGTSPGGTLEEFRAGVGEHQKARQDLLDLASAKMEKRLAENVKATEQRLAAAQKAAAEGEATQYQAGYEMQQAKAAQAAEQAGQRIAVQATDDLGSFTGRVFEVDPAQITPQRTFKLLLRTEGQTIAKDGYRTGLQGIEAQAPVVNWPVVDPETGTWARRPAQDAFDELSTLGSKAFRGNADARKAYALTKSVILDSLPAEAKQAFLALQRQYAERMGLVGWADTVGPVKGDTLQVDLKAVQESFRKGKPLKRLEKRIGEEGVDALMEMFRIGQGPLPTPKGPFTLPPSLAP